MTWREDLRRVKFGDGRTLIGATFRGVPFFVEASERSGGRRTVVHQFPFVDDPFVEDLGRDARTFHVDGYVIGDDYLTQRDTLLAALEDTEGPGTFVHPYHGVRIAICTKHAVHESKDEGGIAKFSIDFTETPAQAPVPTVASDQAGQVSASAAAASSASAAELAAKYNPANLPDRALASAQTALTKAAAAVQKGLAPIVSDAQEAASLTSQVAIITAEASSLVRQPALIYDKLTGAITSLAKTIAAAPGDVMNALIDAYSADLGELVPQTTATRIQEAANQTALFNALRSVFAIQAATLAPTVPYVSIDDATAARDSITAILDAQAASVGDTAYPAIVDLRSSVMEAVPGSNAFASILTVTRRVPIPSILLAYQLYGSVDLELDIVARNDVRNPGFVVGDLKVLSNG